MSETRSHRPQAYKNPFELLVAGIEEGVLSKQQDIFYQDAYITAFISITKPPNLPFNALVIPNRDFENLYVIPDETLWKIHSFSKRLALAYKTLFQVDGVSIRQHNEPAGSQDVFHYHLHVMPRFHKDLFHEENWHFVPNPIEERKGYADTLKAYFLKTT